MPCENENMELCKMEIEMSFDLGVNGLQINHLSIVEQFLSVCIKVTLGEENYSFCCNEAFWRAYLYGPAKKAADPTR